MAFLSICKPIRASNLEINSWLSILSGSSSNLEVKNPKHQIDYYCLQAFLYIIIY